MQLIKIQDYTEKCGLPESTIRRYCREGILPAMRIGRRYYIDEPEADAVLKEQVNLSTAQRRASPNVPELRGKERDGRNAETGSYVSINHRYVPVGL